MSEPNSCAINVAQTGLIVKVRIGRKGVQSGQSGAQRLSVDEVADAVMRTHAKSPELLKMTGSLRNVSVMPAKAGIQTWPHVPGP